MKKIIISLTVLFFMIPFAENAHAQWGIGASYEVRNEDPTNGFGVRVERSILGMVPIVDFNMRAHFSYFNETNALSPSGASISGDAESYDYGLAVTAGVNIALIKPYVGFGIGSETIDFKSEMDPESELSFKEANFYWNAFGGAELRLLPLLNPFIEYRITNLTGTDQIRTDNIGRFAIGINLRF
jgi:opacity protein-like surface antigen